MAAKAAPIYQLKVSLVNASPPIWRRILVPAHVTLDELHLIIQAAMGWDNYHMHAFRVGDTFYGEPNEELEFSNESRMTLKRAAPKEKSRFRYEYDFGDDWQHDVLMEKIVPAELGMQYPVCIKGKRACPPEDSGGIWAYMGLIETLADPSSEDYEEMKEWVDEDFDPEAFSLEEANERLRTYEE